jgi:hypothetical protein
VVVNDHQVRVVDIDTGRILPALERGEIHVRCTSGVA